MADEILDSAARVLGERGEASMADIAAAAGVGRATLYRYFPSREVLLRQLVATAVAEAESRVAQARLDTVPFEEAMRRLVRALVAVGSRYIVLLRDDVTIDESMAERVLGTPIRALFRRGRREGLIRQDLPLVWIEELFAGVLLGGLRLASEQGLGVEEASATLVSLFMDGARPWPGQSASGRRQRRR